MAVRRDNATRTSRKPLCGAALLPAVAVIVFSILSSGRAPAFEWNQENSCVVLNACNTHPLISPDECFTDVNLLWCDCSRTVLTNPFKGAASGVELGIIWILDNPGIGNLRLDVNAGTLDLDGLAAGDLIGTTLTHELIPEGVGVPPGTFFTVEGEIRVTEVRPDGVDFEVEIVKLSSAAKLILGTPLTDRGPFGLLYEGRITPGDPGKGFRLEFRYILDEGAAIGLGDVAGPGFNVRFAMSFFVDGTAAADAYTLPQNDSVLETETTIRKFREDTLDEILELGVEDLCEVLGDEVEPCKLFEDAIELRDEGSNNPPIADICVTSAENLEELVEESIFIECGEARALLRGSNSTDGDDGAQGLSYLWEVIEGPEGGAVIPDDTRTFMDTEISFVLPGIYTIRLTVDDGQPQSNTDTEEVTVEVIEGFVLENEPPAIVALLANGEDILTDLAVSVEITDGSATVQFDSDVTSGDEGCLQTLILAWEAVSGPGPVEFRNPDDNSPTATFTVPGEYVIRYTVDDGAPENNLTAVEITVTVAGGGNTFQLCDANGSGGTDLSDAVFTFNFLFLGGPAAACGAATDCNSDGNTDVSDGIFTLNFLFTGGPTPADPFPGCTSAAAADCAESTPCEP